MKGTIIHILFLQNNYISPCPVLPIGCWIIMTGEDIFVVVAILSK